jgi:hypothetical protein
MAHVTLKKEHLTKIAEIMIMVVEWKAHALSPKSFETFETNWLPKFLEQMKLVEQKIKQDAMTYSKEWFGKEIKSMDVMDEKISPMLKYPKIKGTEERNLEEPPSLSLKLPCWKGVWQTSVFDEDYNQLYVSNYSIRCSCVV